VLLVVEVAQRLLELVLVDTKLVGEIGESRRHAALEREPRPGLSFPGAVGDGGSVISLRAQPVAHGRDGERAADDDDCRPSLL
jgi:hypothetical protein